MINPESKYDFSMPIGSIIMFPGEIYEADNKGEKTILKENIRLSGLHEADGALLKIEDFPVLYEILGRRYSYSSDSEECFRIPDLRGLFIRGVQNNARNIADYKEFDDKDAVNGKRLEYSTLHEAESSKDNELVGTLQVEEFKQHDHTIRNLVQIVGGTESQGGLVFGPETPMSKRTEMSDDRGVETRPNNIALYFLIKIEKNHFRSV